MNRNNFISITPYNNFNDLENDELKIKNDELKIKNDELKKENYYDYTDMYVDEYLDTNKSMYDNRGKYYDFYLFNKKFDKNIEKQNREKLLKYKIQLNDLNRIENIKLEPYQLPFNEILINLKNLWFYIFDNIVKLNFPSDILNTDNLFYFGISFIIIYIFFIMLNFIFE